MSLCPFRFYFHKTGLGFLASAIVISVVIIFWINPACERHAQSVALEEAESLKVIAEMPEEWRRLYSSLSAVSLFDRYDALKKIVEDGGMGSFAPIEGKQLESLLRLICREDRGAALEILSPHVTNNGK